MGKGESLSLPSWLMRRWLVRERRVKALSSSLLSSLSVLPSMLLFVSACDLWMLVQEPSQPDPKIVSGPYTVVDRRRQTAGLGLKGDSVDAACDTIEMD